MGLAERLQERIEALGISQSELARQVGVAPQSIWKLCNNKSSSSIFLPQIARALGTTVDYLTGETDDPGSAPAPVVAANGPDVLNITEIDLVYGMGASFLAEDSAVEADTLPFPRKWVRHFTDSPADQLFFARGAGDSMMPTIHDSDIVLIDRAQNSVRISDQIWAFAFGDAGMIKRLRPRPDGSVAILSDNQLVPEDRALDGEIHIIGRVVAVQKKV